MGGTPLPLRPRRRASLIYWIQVMSVGVFTKMVHTLKNYPTPHFVDFSAQSRVISGPPSRSRRLGSLLVWLPSRTSAA
jgi:hypothetical protein